MIINDIPHYRIISQQIAGTKCKTAKEIVGWMGAMQAQDFSMARWGVGMRLPGSTEETITEAINRGEIIRTHLMRPTWHIAAAEDIHWMLELTAPQIKTFMRSRDNALGLTPDVIKKSSSIIEKALQKEMFLTREALAAKLKSGKILTGDNRVSHILMQAELAAIICSGKAEGNRQTYTLLPERVKQKKRFTHDEALAQLAERYFRSHCPATLNDFIWWSGLPVRDARLALEIVKEKFVSETIGENTYYFTGSFTFPKRSGNSVHLIPAYDEFIISYKDRSAFLSKEINKKAISNNGVFKPVIVVNGLAAGIWKRRVKKDKMIFTAELFRPVDKSIKNLIEKEAAAYGRFLNRKVEIS
jgi:hypothetical protein